MKRTVASSENTELHKSDTSVASYVPLANTAAKDLTVGIILWFFLGWAAGHRWYYGKPVGWNILFIITAGGLGVWWVIDLVNMIQGNF
ncbi:TM2 domain-containing protein [Aestuariivivens insulae]|uniref:TM2 domain-containing protein n=1 Tax=Aestuariivivens insulae TaxID=1621988 RepID=UPI001F563165|nr:TM2 domain-containing protein [Aestuariivivens insulae]